MEQILNLLTYGTSVLPGQAQPRLIAHGKQQLGETKVESIPPIGQRTWVKLGIVMSLHGGGRELTRQQATLLERGHDIGWVSHTAEDILKKAGYGKVQSIAQMLGGKHRTQEVIKLCQDCQIPIPDVEERRASKQIASQQTQKQRRLQPVPPDPSEYRIEPGFLLYQDGSPCEQIHAIASQANGVAFLTPAQSEPRLPGGQQLSKDEPCIFIVGRPTIDSVLPKKDILLPCRNQVGQQVILAGTLVQLGSRHVSTVDDAKGQVELKTSTIVACTVWKSDWSTDDWSEF
eukprot:Skav221256  [mRNA]  locus=scaffold1045:759781:760644:+ [translate_table: standard]